MDEIRETALAYYAKLPQSDKQQAQEFFRSMDEDGDKRVDLKEYMAALKQRGMPCITNASFFKELDKDGNEKLDFNEVITLFYLIQSGRVVLCDGCQGFLKGVYFTCVDCFKSSTANSFYLCCTCYRANKFQHHEDAVFVDNYVLVQSIKGQQVSQSQPPPLEDDEGILESATSIAELNHGLKLFGIYQG
ncbi:hypothetical protein DITRI_Ditri08aG0029200 [Diplodiscus trichospermus]